MHPGYGGSRSSRALARQKSAKSMVSESIYSQRTADTITQTGTSTFDIHNILTLHQFPLPPGSPGRVPSSPVPRSSPSVTENQSVEESHVSSGHEDILQDDYINRLLTSSTRDTASPAPDRLSRLQPPSPTSTGIPRRPSPSPSSPSLPSPLLNVYFPPSGSGHPIQDPLNAGSESSKTSFALTTNTASSSSQSRRTTIIRLDSAPPPSSPAGTTSVVGFARASYIPKSAASSPPAPIIIPSVYSASNLIDLTSPGHTPPRSPSRAALSPRPSYFDSALPPVHEGGLSPSPQTSRFRVSMSPGNILSPLPSPTDEAPLNVPEDIVSADDPGPSTSGLTRGGTQHRRRFSMSSLFSRLTKSTGHSTAMPRLAWTQNRSNWGRQDVPPVPPLPKDHSETEKRESEMQLPALVTRAGYLSNLLDAGRLPVRNSVSTYHGVPGTPSAPEHPVPVEPATPPPHRTPSVRPEETPWEYSSGEGYVDDTAVRNRRSQSIRSFFTRGTTTDRSHFNILDEELQRRYQAELAASSAGLSSGRLGSDLPMEGQSVSRHSSPAVQYISPVPSEKSRRGSSVPAGSNPDARTSIWPWTRLHPKAPWRWKRRITFAVLLNVIFVAAVVGLAVGLTAPSRKHSSSSTTGSDIGGGNNCPGNWTGGLCNLDATCSCATASSICNPLAVAIANVIPKANALLNTSYTATSVALTIWDMQGTPVGGNCAQQAALLDIEPKNADTTHLTWASAAVLYSALQSEDLIAAQALRAFVTSLDFSTASSNSTIKMRSASQTFQKLSSGFIFDFEAMTITAPPLTWKVDASPSSEDVAQVPSSLEAVLDRFTTSASALSNQSTTALQNYWTKDLGQDASRLPKFITAFQSAPVLLPFDMTLDTNGASLAAIMQLHDPKTMSFPPPLACNPMINSQQLKALNSVEQAVFGLPAVPSVPSTFNTSCFGMRPVYGVLDLLGLRLPFNSDESGMPLQAAVLTSAAASRALVRSGSALSTYPSGPGADVPLTALLPANYGTMLHLNHVALDYLQSLSLDQAKLVASLVSGTSSVALNSTTLGSIPILEVAFFGSVGPTGIDHSVSSFSSPSGSLFFGSASGNVFRQWAANTAETATEAVIWAESAVALQVVKETAANDTTFEGVWNGASTIITNANTLGTTTGSSDVETVVGVFGTLGYLSD
ncbi:hypothetical protein FRB93_002737 [Tulasnella sp. JGI-2019a]|nr:hypothetical protein FRB93_002737 [Tulasnella sp. JGI-2019a]